MDFAEAARGGGGEMSEVAAGVRWIWQRRRRCARWMGREAHAVEGGRGGNAWWNHGRGREVAAGFSQDFLLAWKIFVLFST